ncbi:unnamed protein product [Brachionus calyciflorus]|uniref:Uncharacterized protein n=1 Tax=Brachionus calyciflorus TaxID=104777 RepID=A0A814CD72_9BILA|nr:unnamed protein product [Brachionus calyciflorus]
MNSFKNLSLGLLLILLAISVDSYQHTRHRRIRKTEDKDRIQRKSNSFRLESPEDDLYLIYSNPFLLPSFDPFFQYEYFNNLMMPMNPMMQLNNMFYDNFRLGDIHKTQSIMMNKLLNSFPSFPKLETQAGEDLRDDFKIEVESCDNLNSEKNTDNFVSDHGFFYHFESTSCGCNQTDYCKLSYAKPDLDFCYLREIESEPESSSKNCELLESCLNDDKNCDGIYVDHRLMKYFKVYCKGDKTVQNIPAKSAKQFIIELKNCL